MARKVFVNLPVTDLDKSVEFFTRLGFTFNPAFTDDTATAMIVSDDAFVMLLVRDKFAGFTSKQLCDTTTHTEVLLALSADSRENVDRMVTTASEAGGQPANDVQDHGFMYGWSFQDLDGHTWEVMWMDPDGMTQ
jgi:predicted lactoylglutathione lyase